MKRRQRTPDEGAGQAAEGDGVANGDGRVDRRTFIRRAGAAGAGAVLLGPASGTAAQGDEPSPSRKAKGSAPYRHQGIPDVVIVGAGVFGIFNAFYLRRLGLDVTVVDLYGPGNSKATSGGETRGVRTSYGDRPHGGQWMTWADEAIRRWKRIDEEWKDRLVAPLFYQTGDLIMRDETTPYMEETRALWDERDIPYEVLGADEIEYRWPQIATENVGAALYEPRAGVVRARRACETVADVFQQEGGTIRIAHARIGGRLEDRVWDVELTPGGERLRAGQFVFALGPWFPKAFPEIMAGRIRVSTLGHTAYFGTPPGDNRFTFPNLPSYGVPGCTGWPALPPDNRGFRVRTGGRTHHDPDRSPRRLDAEHVERHRQILRDWFPELLFAPVVETRACHYESSVTRNFIIDRHPDYSNVWLTGGGSAEAFKQGPVLGEYIAHRVAGLDTDPELDESFRLPEEQLEEEPGG